MRSRRTSDILFGALVAAGAACARPPAPVVANTTASTSAEEPASGRVVTTSSSLIELEPIRFVGPSAVIDPRSPAPAAGGARAASDRRSGVRPR